MLEDIKLKFPVFNQKPNLIFLDTAASALKVDEMIKATNNCYSYEYANIKPDIASTATISESKVILNLSGHA